LSITSKSWEERDEENANLEPGYPVAQTNSLEDGSITELRFAKEAGDKIAEIPLIANVLKRRPASL
jgi:hypothetical protein